MLERLLIPTTLLALLGSGLIAGVFFAFSSFVMKALAKLPATEGIAAMQSINVVVINPVFLGVFLGTAVLSVGLIVMAWLLWDKPGTAYLLAGAMLYLLGTLLVTIAFNVPLNDSLAAVVSSDPSAGERWGDYVSRWTMWNNVRTVGALLAAGAFAMALLS